MRRVQILTSHLRPAFFPSLTRLATATLIGKTTQACLADPNPYLHYPVYCSSFTAGSARDGIQFENCLSYSLNIQAPSPILAKLDGRTNHPPALEYVATEINQYYGDDQFVIPAAHKKGQLPPFKEGYYLIALAVSYYQKLFHEHLLYQEGDYHFLVQNSDGFFSHRGGKHHSPVRIDSNGKLIKLPESASLMYVGLNEKNEPYCFDYKFKGYLYVKTLALRFKDTKPYTAWFDASTAEYKLDEYSRECARKF